MSYIPLAEIKDQGFHKPVNDNSKPGNANSTTLALAKSVAFAVAGIALLILSGAGLLAATIALSAAPLTLGASIPAAIAITCVASLPIFAGSYCLALSEEHFLDFQSLAQDKKEDFQPNFSD